MQPGNSDKAWERLGQEDPYWAIKGGDRLRAENLDDSSRAEFFASGREHIDSVLEQIRAVFDPAFRPASALDFGCGVGRMVFHLARMCHRVVGVDVSSAMLQEARAHRDKLGLTNVDFVPGDDTLSGIDGRFDFIHSHIVFQHIPVKRGVAIFRRLIDLLNDGGVAAMHFTYYRDVSKMRKAINWARRTLPLVNIAANIVQGERFNLPFHQMNSYDLNGLFKILRDHQIERSFVINLEPSKHFYRMMVYFQKPRRDR